MRLVRLALSLAVVATAAAGSLAGAATPAPFVTDPSGDAKVLGAAYDITSATLSTTGTTKVSGGKTVYTPTALVATVTLAGPPATTPGYALTFRADTSACNGGYFSWSYTPGNPVLGDGDLFVSGCGTDSGLGPATIYDDVTPVIKGSTLTWTLPLKEIGSDLPLKSTFTNGIVTTDQNDPVIGLVGTGLAAPDTSVDSATGTATFTLK